MDERSSMFILWSLAYQEMCGYKRYFRPMKLSLQALNPAACAIASVSNWSFEKSGKLWSTQGFLAALTEPRIKSSCQTETRTRWQRPKTHTMYWLSLSNTHYNRIQQYFYTNCTRIHRSILIKAVNSPRKNIFKQIFSCRVALRIYWNDSNKGENNVLRK